MKSLVNVVPPKCSAHHDMIVSDYSEGGYSSGYVCDKCRGQSNKGHLGGSRERWFCKECKADICFKCKPKGIVASQRGSEVSPPLSGASVSYIVCSYGNNVRKTPSLSGKKVGTIYKGTKVSVVEVRSIQGVKWLRLEDDTWTMGTTGIGEELLRVS